MWPGLFKLASEEIRLGDIFSCYVLVKKNFFKVFLEFFVHGAKTNSCKKKKSYIENDSPFAHIWDTTS